jgi:hypothetical protein
MQRAASVFAAALILATVPAGLQAQAPDPVPIPVYIVEQLVISAPLAPDLARDMEPMKTLAEVEALLKARNIQFGWRHSLLNAAQVDPRLLAQIMNLPPGEVFVMPGSKQIFISVIVGQR